MVCPSIVQYEKALELQNRWKFSYYDSLIIEAALSIYPESMDRRVDLLQRHVLHV